MFIIIILFGGRPDDYSDHKDYKAGFIISIILESLLAQSSSGAVAQASEWRSRTRQSSGRT